MADKNLEQISDLIQQTGDAETRAVLLILYKIADSLQKNSSVTEKIVQDLQKQDDTIAKLSDTILAQNSTRKGANGVLKWVLLLSQSVLLSIVGYLYIDYSHLKDTVTKIETTLNIIQKKL